MNGSEIDVLMQNHQSSSHIGRCVGKREDSIMALAFRNYFRQSCSGAGVMIRVQ